MKLLLQPNSPRIMRKKLKSLSRHDPEQPGDKLRDNIELEPSESKNQFITSALSLENEITFS